MHQEERENWPAVDIYKYFQIRKVNYLCQLWQGMITKQLLLLYCSLDFLYIEEYIWKHTVHPIKYPSKCGGGSLPWCDASKE